MVIGCLLRCSGLFVARLRRETAVRTQPMRHRALFVLIMWSASARADAPTTPTSNDVKHQSLGQLIITGPDAAKVPIEGEGCPDFGEEWATREAALRKQFIDAMLANTGSKLARLRASYLKELLRDEPWLARSDAAAQAEYVAGHFLFTDWAQTYYERSGCGESFESYSSIVQTMGRGNMHKTVSRYLVTIDFDRKAGRDGKDAITLKLRSAQPLKIRDQ